ncbi:MAG: hypothetical protein J6K23_03035 [Bacilli bacterium]|nr:hypothetical protein [Bacilli bacterium]
MATKKHYINLIRWSCIIDSFNSYYFIRIIVIYLLAQNVTPWVAVSIPIVLEFARLLSRGIDSIAKLALKVDYKKYHIFHLIIFLILCLVISQCRNVFTLYFFTLIAGILNGIKFSSITKMNTQNKDYEPYCFIEEERSNVIGGTLGLLISQLVYDISPIIYLIGFVILLVIGTIFSLLLKSIPLEDDMESIEENEELDQKSKNNTILVTTLFALLAGFWCIGWGGFTELAPLISNKIGYLESVYTILEIILLCIISGSLLQKINKNKKLLFVETVIACIDVSCLLIASLTLSWKGLLIAYIITAITSTMGDPIWGSIMSAYSTNDRRKWVLVNKVYFVIRAGIQIVTWVICRECVIRGVESFRYLSIILIILIIITYLIANKVNKKVFGSSI